MAYPATPKTWVAGDVLTAAQLNAELRNALLAMFPLGPPDLAWTSYTPTLTQSGAVTKTVSYGRYTKVGRLVVAQTVLAATGAGSAGVAVAIGLPVTAAAATSQSTGYGHIFDASTGLLYKGIARIASTTTVSLLPAATTDNNYLGAAHFTLALAAGDEIGMTATYESAT